MLGPNGQNPPGFAKATEGEKKKREGWQLAKDRARLKKQLQEARDSCRPDADLIAGLAAELRAANDELRANGKAAQ